MERRRVPGSPVPAYADQLFTQRPGRVYREAMAVLEGALLLHALTLTGGNQLRAARLLGLNRNTLRKRCRELGLLPPAGPRAAGDAMEPAASPPGTLPANGSGDHDLPVK